MKIRKILPGKNFGVKSKETTRNTIFVRDESLSIEPIVLDYDSLAIKDSIDTMVTLEFHCTVNKSEMKQKNIDHIAVGISKNNIDYYNSRGKQTVSNDITRNKSVISKRKMSSKEMLTSISNSKGFKRDRNKNLYEDVFFFSKFAYEEVKEVLLYRTQSLQQEKNTIKDRLISEYNNELASSLTSFKRFYNKNKFSHIYDTMSFFHEGHNVINRRDKNLGRTYKYNNVSLIDVEKMKNTIIQKLKIDTNTFASEFASKVTKKKKIIDNLTLTSTNRLSFFKSVGETFNLILVAKKRNGEIVETSSYTLKLSNIKRQMNKESTEYSLSVNRRSSDVSMLSIESDRSLPAHVSVYAKSIDPSKSMGESDYLNILSKITIDKKTTILDGNLSTTAKRPEMFNGKHDVFYRTSLCFNGAEYNNSKCIVDMSSKKNKNFPSLNIYARSMSYENHIAVSVTNISDNISAIKIMKYRYNNKTRGVISNIHDLYRKSVSYKNTETSSKLVYSDYDVFDEKTYMYIAVCIMNNGEIKTANTSCLETYEKASELVTISNVMFDTQSIAEINTDNLDTSTRRVKCTFDMMKIKTDADKVLSSLFGDMYNLFKDDVENIKDINNLIYSVEIVRIDSTTGELKTIDKVITNEASSAVFYDNVLIKSDIIYKFIPRVSFSSEITSKINEKIEKIGQRNFFNKINYSFAANRKRGKLFSEKVISKTSGKFSKRSLQNRGIIETDEIELEKNSFDMFKDSSTGDIHYSTLASPIDAKSSNKQKISKSSISRIKYHSNKKNDDTILSVIKFDITNDYAVDYYIFCVKEEDNIYIDGAIHSKDSLEKTEYNYLIKHSETFGKIDYYLIPVLKSGNVGSTSHITSQVIQ